MPTLSSLSLGRVLLVCVFLLLHLTCSSAQEIIEVDAHRSYNGTVPAGEYVYYSFRPHSTNQPVDLHLWVATGYVWLLVSYNDSRPYPYRSDNMAANQTFIAGSAGVAGLTWFSGRLSTANPYSCYRRNVSNADCIYHMAVITFDTLKAQCVRSVCDTSYWQATVDADTFVAAPSFLSVCVRVSGVCRSELGRRYVLVLRGSAW